MSYLDGRRRPRAAERSNAVLKSNADAFADAEVLVRIFSHTIQEGHEETAPILLHRLKDRRLARSRAVSSEEIAAVFAHYKHLRTRWSELPVGGAIELEW